MILYNIRVLTFISMAAVMVIPWTLTYIQVLQQINLQLQNIFISIHALEARSDARC